MLPKRIVLLKINPAAETTEPKSVYVVITPKANKNEAETLDFLLSEKLFLLPRIDTVTESKG